MSGSESGTGGYWVAAPVEDVEGWNENRGSMSSSVPEPLLVAMLVFVGLCVFLAVAVMICSQKMVRRPAEMAEIAKKSTRPHKSMELESWKDRREERIRVVEVNADAQSNRSTEKWGGTDRGSTAERRVASEDMHVLQMLPFLPVIQHFRPTMANCTLSPEICVSVQTHSSCAQSAGQEAMGDCVNTWIRRTLK